MKKDVAVSETSPVQVEGAAVISVGERPLGFANLAASLAEIRKLKGVTGYILRSDTSAIVDLTENDKVSYYALFASQVNESSCELAKQFNLSNVENVLVEGKKLKVLSLNFGENNVSIFMEKTAAHTWIMKRIRI